MLPKRNMCCQARVCLPTRRRRLFWRKWRTEIKGPRSCPLIISARKTWPPAWLRLGTDFRATPLFAFWLHDVFAYDRGLSVSPLGYVFHGCRLRVCGISEPLIRLTSIPRLIWHQQRVICLWGHCCSRVYIRRVITSRPKFRRTWRHVLGVHSSANP